MTLTKNIELLKMYMGYFKDAKNPKKTIKRKCYLFIRGGVCMMLKQKSL
jgi:hypothetical protein